LKITAWRIFKKKYKSSAFSGEGARRFGGRWNSKGVAVVYTSETPSLAVLEILVHLPKPDILDAYLLASVSLDDSLVETIAVNRLPSNWRNEPAPVALQHLGDQWVAQARSLALRVPSVIIDTEKNLLLNPAHPGFGECLFGKPRPFRFDPRFAQ
jgi:RES domain-containing protein